MFNKMLSIAIALVIIGLAFMHTNVAKAQLVKEQTPLKEKFPGAGEAISLIEGFPLLEALLELDDPWKGDPVRLKERLFPEEVTLAQGSEETPLLFNGQRSEGWPGLAVWDQWACETDYNVTNPARPAIRLHLGRASHRRPELVPPLNSAASAQLSSNIKKIVEGLRPYGARQLPFKHPSIAKYLLPGGSRLTFSDFSGSHDRGVYLEIAMEPATPIKALLNTRLPAFPGAEGAGGYSAGGRGGEVYLVTTLDDYLPFDRRGQEAGPNPYNPDGPPLPGYPTIPREDPIPGSLREAIDAEGPRVIMFAVSGTIELVAPLIITNPYVTIVAHTAPGEGVQIRNWPIYIHTHDVVMRYLRVRVGDIKGPGKIPRVLGEGSWATDIGSMNVIVDHCEFAYANDQVTNIRCYDRDRRGNVSFQWSYTYGALDKSTHPKGGHSCGYGTGGWGNVSFHHNLTAHAVYRNPRVWGLRYDWRNNVLYNYQGSGYGSSRDYMKFNYIGNVQKRGRDKHAFRMDGQRCQFYEANNIMPEGSERVLLVDDSVLMDEPFEIEQVATDPPMVAYEKVLKYGGASLPVRDVITQYVADTVRNNTGKIPNVTDDWPHGGYATYKPARPAPDADKDGMPDAWEKKYGLDPNNASDNAGDKDEDGYTNIEEYINDTNPTEFIDYRKPENNVHSLHRADTIHWGAGK